VVVAALAAAASVDLWAVVAEVVRLERQAPGANTRSASAHRP